MGKSNGLASQEYDSQDHEVEGETAGKCMSVKLESEMSCTRLESIGIGELRAATAKTIAQLSTHKSIAREIGV